jgi:hypothetical protein
VSKKSDGDRLSELHDRGQKDGAASRPSEPPNQTLNGIFNSKNEDKEDNAYRDGYNKGWKDSHK